jgi:hypothetical protein
MEQIFWGVEQDYGFLHSHRSSSSFSSGTGLGFLEPLVEETSLQTLFSEDGPGRAKATSPQDNEDRDRVLSKEELLSLL